MTRLAALVAKAAGTDPFGLANYNQLKANSDYLTVAGADLASAATVTITSEFHGITGVTQIDNIADASGLAAGQQARLWIKGGPLKIRDTGGGTGNLRLLGGADRVVPQNEIVSFVYDGTVWREAGKLRGLTFIYSTGVQVINNLTVTARAFNAEVTDDAGQHDTVTNNSRITFASPGLHLIGSRSLWTTNGSGGRLAIIRLNAATDLVSDDRPAGGAYQSTGDSAICIPHVVQNAGDYIELYVGQSSGGTLNHSGGTFNSSSLWAQKV